VQRKLHRKKAGQKLLQRKRPQEKKQQRKVHSYESLLREAFT
jgi:hypothetical protein